jgi:hypothetical protein
LLAEKENFLSFSWKDNQPDLFTVDVDLGEAQNFSNFTTDQSNGTGSIFFFFSPNTRLVNSVYTIYMKVNEIENFSTNLISP